MKSYPTPTAPLGVTFCRFLQLYQDAGGDMNVFCGVTPQNLMATMIAAGRFHRTWGAFATPASLVTEGTVVAMPDLLDAEGRFRRTSQFLSREQVLSATKETGKRPATLVEALLFAALRKDVVGYIVAMTHEALRNAPNGPLCEVQFRLEGERSIDLVLPTLLPDKYNPTWKFLAVPLEAKPPVLRPEFSTLERALEYVGGVGIRQGSSSTPLYRPAALPPPRQLSLTERLAQLFAGVFN